MYSAYEPCSTSQQLSVSMTAGTYASCQAKNLLSLLPARTCTGFDDDSGELKPDDISDTWRRRVEPLSLRSLCTVEAKSFDLIMINADL